VTGNGGFVPNQIDRKHSGRDEQEIGPMIANHLVGDAHVANTCVTRLREHCRSVGRARIEFR
jgi:hypothetical protein